MLLRVKGSASGAPFLAFRMFRLFPRVMHRSRSVCRSLASSFTPKYYSLWVISAFIGVDLA